MKGALENLSKAGAELYAHAQQAAGAAPGDASAGAAGSPGSDDPGAARPEKKEKKADVVDADFEVVDDDKKK
jgi:molecular chaperone DnaK